MVCLETVWPLSKVVLSSVLAVGTVVPGINKVAIWQHGSVIDYACTMLCSSSDTVVR